MKLKDLLEKRKQIVDFNDSQAALLREIKTYDDEIEKIKDQIADLLEKLSKTEAILDEKLKLDLSFKDTAMIDKEISKIKSKK